MYCKKCKKQIADVDRFCHYCGFDNGEIQNSPNIENSKINQTIIQSNQKQNDNSGIIIVISAFIFATIIIFGLIKIYNIFSIPKSNNSHNYENKYEWQNYVPTKLTDNDIKVMDRNDFELIDGMNYIGTYPITDSFGLSFVGIQRIFKIDSNSLSQITSQQLNDFTNSAISDLPLIENSIQGIQIVILTDNENSLFFRSFSPIWECKENLILEKRELSHGWHYWYAIKYSKSLAQYGIENQTEQDFANLISNCK